MSDFHRGNHPDPELLTSLADGELDPTTRDAVLSHVASCADCRPALDVERRLKAAVRTLPGSGADLVPSADLLARLRAVPAEADPAVVSLAERRARRASRTPAYLGAAASFVVFMVGAFAFLGATGPSGSPSGPAGGVAIVPAADRLTLEHAATNGQTSLGGPDVTAVSVNLPASTPTAVSR